MITFSFPSKQMAKITSILKALFFNHLNIESYYISLLQNLNLFVQQETISLHVDENLISTLSSFKILTLNITYVKIQNRHLYNSSRICRFLSATDEMQSDHQDKGIHVQVNGKDGSVQHDNSLEVIEESQSRKLLYKINDVPPWYLCIILGFQVRIRFTSFILTFCFSIPFLKHNIKYIYFRLLHVV